MVATFSIRVIFRHPTIDPAIITKTVGVQPTIEARVGHQVRAALDGTPRHGANPESVWGALAEFYDEDPKIGPRLKEFLEPFQRNAAFVRRLAAESTVSVVDLEFPGQFHFGGNIAAAVLRMVADLGLNLGIEVFPDSAT